MRKFKPNLAFVTGLLLYAIAQFMKHGLEATTKLSELLLGMGTGLVIVGAIFMAFPKFLHNTKFYHFKQRLIGKE